MSTRPDFLQSFPQVWLILQYHVLLKERDACLEAKTTEVRRAEEELIRLRKDAERQQSKYRLMATGSSSQKEAELQQDLDKVWVSAY